jgi:hypothetical protein
MRYNPQSSFTSWQQSQDFVGVLGEVDRALENAFEGYLAANQRFAQTTHNIEAVQAGRDAAVRGRTETVPAYRRLQPQGQQAFRSGHVDPLIFDAQGAAFGANTVGPLTSAAFRDEAARRWRPGTI